MVATMRHLLAAFLLLLAASAEAQTFGSSTVETSPAALTVSGAAFTPTCPTVGGGFAVQNIVVTAINQSIALPSSCPSSSVGLFVTLNICNGKGGTAPCNGTASGPFSPGITFGTGYEFPTPPGVYSATQAGGAKDLVTCEVMGTTGPWSCGTPQYAMTGISTLPALGAGAHTGSVSSSPFTATITTQGSSGVLDLFVLTNASSTTAPTVSSTTLGSWTLRKQQVSTANVNDFISEFSAPFTSTLTSEVVTVTLSGLTFGTVDVFEIKNAPTSSYFDPNGALPAGVTGVTTASITTSSAPTMLLCAYRFNGATPSAGSGFTVIGNADFQLSEYQVVSSTQSGTVCTIGTLNGNQDAGIGDAIK